MLASAQAIEGIPILPDDMDRDRWLLNTHNGTIDLRDGTLRKHAREDYITRCLNVPYDPDAKCPLWEQFLDQVFGGDAGLVSFVQRAIGYSLTGSTEEHVFFILHGLGSNGKSTFLGVVHALQGPYAGLAPVEMLMARRGEHHPTERATLFGKRFISTMETSGGRRLDEGLVKRITGSDRIECRRMGEDFWEFDPTHKLWLATNYKPKVIGTDLAIWRRIRLIPFDQTFHEPETGLEPQKDKTLPARLLEELPGILAWAVRGCLEWQREGLNASAAVRNATDGYRAEMDVLAAFFEECCIFNPQAEARASHLYAAYKRWCEAAGEHADTQTTFGTRLRERLRGMGLVETQKYGRRTWIGIGLLSDEEGEDGKEGSSGRSYVKSTNFCGRGAPSSPSSKAGKRPSGGDSRANSGDSAPSSGDSNDADSEVF